MKTILITGCSSGFGHETALYFLERGWKVIATMRKPQADLFPDSENLRLLPLDVSNEASIRQAIAEAGEIDVLVNNAGIGVLAALEGMEMSTVRDVFETNTLGTIAMTQAVLPQFRAKQSGTVINVTSTVTLKSLPLLAVYTASKAAVNAFTESLALELQPFNVNVRLVLPGMAPTTDFGKNAMSRMDHTQPEPYQPLFDQVLTGMQQPQPTTKAIDVAEAIWRAATDPSAPLRIPAGEDAVALMHEVG
ncbi:MAG TPA: short-chain dehydrogenase/reductase [Pantoea sp.]|uniref:SDR family oxidoreductase n=1 Tax=Pantoea piersonii TaxID=2364647 RepID=UPI000EE4B6AB|nr:SDR family oxidoreductase [Pantoea piersonii]WBV23234.1 SDR family oxidoreductase [Pantoea piersonii]HCW97394.1 short-chain dehydrogenase/reductase [Pantoea sp.]